MIIATRNKGDCISKTTSGPSGHSIARSLLYMVHTEGAHDGLRGLFSFATHGNAVECILVSVSLRNSTMFDGHSDEIHGIGVTARRVRCEEVSHSGLKMMPEQYEWLIYG